MKKPPLPFRQCPLVKLGSFPLTRHELTLGQFSEDLVRPLYGEKGWRGASGCNYPLP